MATTTSLLTGQSSAAAAGARRALQSIKARSTVATSTKAEADANKKRWTHGMNLPPPGVSVVAFPGPWVSKDACVAALAERGIDYDGEKNLAIERSTGEVLVCSFDTERGSAPHNDITELYGRYGPQGVLRLSPAERSNVDLPQPMFQ